MKPNSDSLSKFFDVDPLEVRLWKETGEFFAGKRELDDTIDCIFQ